MAPERSATEITELNTMGWLDALDAGLRQVVNPTLTSKTHRKARSGR